MSIEKSIVHQHINLKQPPETILPSDRYIDGYQFSCSRRKKFFSELIQYVFVYDILVNNTQKHWHCNSMAHQRRHSAHTIEIQIHNSFRNKFLMLAGNQAHFTRMMHVERKTKMTESRSFLNNCCDNYTSNRLALFPWTMPPIELVHSEQTNTANNNKNKFVLY